MPPAPTGADAGAFIDIDGLWGLMTGDDIGLNEVEVGVVFRRIKVATSKPGETGGEREHVMLATFAVEMV